MVHPRQRCREAQEKPRRAIARPTRVTISAKSQRLRRQQRRLALSQHTRPGRRRRIQPGSFFGALATGASSGADPSSSPCAALEVSQCPLLLIPIGKRRTSSDRSLQIEAAESRETSCSPLRPPNKTPTRNFFAIRSFYACLQSVSCLFSWSFGFSRRNIIVFSA